MSRRCDLTDKGGMSGNLVSHSNRKTRTVFRPNIKPFSLGSDVLNKKFVFSLCVSTIRTIEAKGGLDNFLINTPSHKLSVLGRKLKKQVLEAKNQASA